MNGISPNGWIYDASTITPPKFSRAPCLPSNQLALDPYPDELTRSGPRGIQLT